MCIVSSTSGSLTENGIKTAYSAGSCNYKVIRADEPCDKIQTSQPQRWGKKPLNDERSIMNMDCLFGGVTFARVKCEFSFSIRFCIGVLRSLTSNETIESFCLSKTWKSVFTYLGLRWYLNVEIELHFQLQSFWCSTRMNATKLSGKCARHSGQEKRYLVRILSRDGVTFATERNMFFRLLLLNCLVYWKGERIDTPDTHTAADSNFWLRSKLKQRVEYSWMYTTYCILFCSSMRSWRKL